MLTWQQLLSVPAMVVGIHLILMVWRRRWRLASRVLITSLVVALLWIFLFVGGIGDHVGDSRYSDDDFVGDLIAISAIGAIHLTVLAVTLVIVSFFDRWKMNR